MDVHILRFVINAKANVSPNWW